MKVNGFSVEEGEDGNFYVFVDCVEHGNLASRLLFKAPKYMFAAGQQKFKYLKSKGGFSKPYFE